MLNAAVQLWRSHLDKVSLCLLCLQELTVRRVEEASWFYILAKFLYELKNEWMVEVAFVVHFFLRMCVRRCKDSSALYNSRAQSTCCRCRNLCTHDTISRSGQRRSQSLCRDREPRKKIVSQPPPPAFDAPSLPPSL